MTDPAALRARADWLHDRLDELPAGPYWGDDAAAARRAAYDKALGNLRVGLETSAEAPARFRERPGVDTAVTMMGIRSSSTSGLASALRNWIAAARKKAAS